MPIIIVLIALAAAGWLGFMAAAGSQYTVILLAGTAMVALFAFFSPKLSLVLLIFSMLLSPELGGGVVDSSRSLVVRYDDILLVIIFLSWFAKSALFKDKPFITSTPVQTPILLYTATCIVATALGVIRGDVDPKASFFYVLKYVEYFLLYFMTINILESEEDVKKYLRYGLIVAVLVTIYAYYFYYSYGGDARATAPFEVPLNRDHFMDVERFAAEREQVRALAAAYPHVHVVEPASLGGYYLVVFGLLMAMLTQTGGYVFLAALGLLIFMFPAFLLTFSRSSYIGFTAMIPALFILSKKRRLFMLGFVSAGIIAISLLPGISGKVMDRITMTYQGAYATQTFQTGVGGAVKLEDSAASRVHSLRRIFLEKLPKHPIFGWGVTGVGLCDTQYALVPGETGILGSIFFVWMLFRLFFTAKTVFYAYSTPLIKALALGFMVMLIGLLFQSLGVNSFVIVRIMEPFWFLAACLSVLYLKAAKVLVRPEAGR